MGGNTIIGPHSYSRKRLEIMQEINFLEDQKRIYPYIQKEAQRNIEVLSNMLGDLEYQYRQQNK